MYKHKWQKVENKWRCGWCCREVPNTPSGRKIAMKPDRTCDRRTPEQRLADDRAADLIDAEVDLYQMAQRLNEPLPELSDAARDELKRRTLWKGQRRARLAMMAATILAGGVK